MIRLNRLALPLLAAVLLTACADKIADTITVTVAPNWGKEVQCVDWIPVPDDSAAWLDRHPEPPPKSWWPYTDYQEHRVKPKLIEDCQ